MVACPLDFAHESIDEAAAWASDRFELVPPVQAAIDRLSF